MTRRGGILAAAALLLFARSVAIAQVEVRPQTKDHRDAAEIRRMLEPIAAEYPASFLAAVYSLPETREVFTGLVGDDPKDPWKYRSIEAFDLHTAPIQKKAVVHNTARSLSSMPTEECDRIVGALRSWCDADRILDLAGAGFEAFFSVDATAGLAERVRPRVPYDPTPRSLAAKLDPPERLSLYKDVLTEVATLDPGERMKFFGQVFAYLAEHPRDWGD